MRKKLAACETLASRDSRGAECISRQPFEVVWLVPQLPPFVLPWQCFMSTALRVGGVAALALVPVAVVLTVWLLRQ